MQLGAFSVSLSVKDIQASKLFYSKLGFGEIGGDIAQNWLILKNGDHVIGLFQGMFDKNMLTFNPGWNQSGEHTNPFQDIRQIQQKLKGEGFTFVTEADEKNTGPSSFMINGPDGNLILVDQHR